MKSEMTNWSVEQRGPAFNTRQEHTDGSVSYEAVYDVSLKFTVIGNDAMEFIKEIQSGHAKLTGLQVESKAKGRKYVFD